MENFQEENLEQKWNETTSGKIVQVIIWPLGLYMMFTVPYFTERTRYILAGICGLGLIMQIFGVGTPSPCECEQEMDRLLQNSIYGDFEMTSKMRACDRAYPNVSYLDLCNE